MIRTCGAPKPKGKVICENCTCDGRQDIEKLAKKANHLIKVLELLKNGNILKISTDALLNKLKE